MLRKIALYFSVSAIAIPITALALCYGLLCSERFVLEYLLPYISETIGTKISASRASISPLHRISLGGVRVNCKDSTPCPSAAPLSLSASSIEITYDLRQLFSRKISITSLRGERIEGSFISGPEHDKPSSPSESLDRSPKTSADSPPTLTINLANINLLNSSFRYVDTSSNGHYTFDAINVEIPKAQSHGNSEIKLSTRVSITSESLKLRDELISGSLTLSDSTFFVPRTIAINADAGSAIPRALQLKGSLDFRKEPYALESIRITKATVRDSLIEALGLPRTQISEFEVDLLGEHSLSGAQPTRATLKVHKAVLPSSYDLAGSSLTSTFTVKEDSVDTTMSELLLITNSTPAAKLALSGSLSLAPYRRRSKFTIEGTDINGDQIESAFAPSASTPAAASTPSPTNQKSPNLQKAETQTSQLPKLPLIDAALHLEGVRYRKIELSQLDGTLVIPSASTITDATINLATTKSGTLSLSAKGDLNSTVKIRAKGEKINLLPMAAVVQKSGDLLEGAVDLLDLDLSLSPATPRTSLTGHARMKVSRCIVPSTLHGQVPFNILFLPFDALITVFGGTLNALLPKSVSSISDGIRQVLDDAGRLGIEEGEIDLGFDKGTVTCNKVQIDTKNLPDFTIKGRVSSTNKLDFTIFIALLKLNVPLPVAGTLQTPLPDVLYLGPEIIRGLGLSVGNIAGGVMSLVGGGRDSLPPPAQNE